MTSQRSRAESASNGNEFLEYIGLAVRNGTAQAFWSDNRGATQGTFVSDLDADSASVSVRNGNNNLVITSDSPGSNSITLRRSALNANFVEVVENGQLQFAGLWASLGSITINASGNSIYTVNIENTVAGKPVTVNLGNGNDLVNISPGAHNLDGIQGTVGDFP